MSLNDFILTAGAVFFIFALVKMVLATEKPPVFSSLTTGFWLGCFALIVYRSEHLWFAMVTTGLSAALWFVLCAQKVRQR